jgi:CubicO group peptidase (beta-lactamase class C family)
MRKWMMKKSVVSVFAFYVAVIFFAVSARAESIPGLTDNGLAQIREQIQQDVEAQKIPGAVVLLARDGKIIFHEAFGNRTGTRTEKLTEASVFRLYSMNKPLVATAAMILVERGKLKLDAPLVNYIPSFAKMRVLHDDGREEVAKRPILIEDLIQHTSGLAYGFFGKGPVREVYRSTCFDCAENLADLAETIARLPLEHHPGEFWEYSRSNDVLGRIVEITSGVTLDTFLTRQIFQPLGMRDSGYGTQDGRAEHLAGGLVYENPTLLSSSQLLSSARDYYRFAQALLNRGVLDGERILKEETVHTIAQDHLQRRNIRAGKYIWKGPAWGWGWGYGFGVQTAPIDKTSDFPLPEGSLFWSGYGGTDFWIDPKNRIIAVFMMDSAEQRWHFRSLMRRLVYLGH